MPGGQCDISWWLTPQVEDVSKEAERIAAAALSDADVSANEWKEWHALLDGDPDKTPPIPYACTAPHSSKSCGPRVRTALESAGYPDTERIIEVHSELSCADS